MRHISLLRFNALAAYTRHPKTILFCDELGWYESHNQKLLAVLIQDDADQDFAGIILGRDERQRYRWTDSTNFYKSKLRAYACLKRKIIRLSKAPDSFHHQLDQDREGLDFFTPVVPRERLHQSFVSLAEAKGFSPAKFIIEPMMRWYEDVDGNFVQQFQTTGFDARIWELYLFAVFVEMGFVIERIHAVPDFTCRGLFGSFAIEAATVNPTQGPGGIPLPLPPRETEEEQRIFIKEYMPIKFGSALISKLRKRYWEKPSAKDLPLMFAIHDFHAPQSMTFTRSALPIYLYGYDWNSEKKNGKLRIVPRKVDFHNWGQKRIPSGFFNLADAENISAVIFSNSGTISKFNRIGYAAEFGARDLKMIRVGIANDPDPNAAQGQPFQINVRDRKYSESWAEGIEVFHNPRAIRPVADEALPGAIHHRLRADGMMISSGPLWQPLTSRTLIFEQQSTKSRSLKFIRRLKNRLKGAAD